MPPIRHIRYISAPDAHSNNLAQLAQLHGGQLAFHHNQHRPYSTRIPTPPCPRYQLPPTLAYQIKHTQDAAVCKTTQAKDANRLRDFLSFCEGLGIPNNHALPANEDLLVAWASSYAGRLAGKSVGAKLLAIRKEHERRGLIWQGGNLLRRTLKGVEELRPASSFRNKRAPVTVPMLLDLDKGLSRSSGLDTCVRAICLLSFFSQLRCGKILPPTQCLAKFNR